MSLWSTTSLVDKEIDKSKDVEFFDESLSVPYSYLHNPYPSRKPSETHMEKASRLLNEGKVIKAPDGNPKTRWVLSDTTSSPHVITTSIQKLTQLDTLLTSNV